MSGGHGPQHGSRHGSQHEILFLAGLARSGTTALQRVLDLHPDVALGMERYKLLWGRRLGELTADRFERERFFDWSEPLTNITPDVEWAAPRIALLDAKWDTARYRGEKMTIVRAQKVWETIPEARFVFIVRDVAQVASSWDRRSANVEDVGWSRSADALHAVEAWNRAAGRIRRAVRQRPEQACVVEYQRFFADPDGASLRAVLTHLDLDPDAPEAAQVWEAFADAHRVYVDSVAGRDRTLPPEVAAFVEEHADRRAWRQVLDLAL